MKYRDAHRNSLNSHCYWALRKDGFSARKASRMMEGIGVAEKNELLFARGINYNDLSGWQKRGVGVEYKTISKEGYDPIQDKPIIAERRALVVNEELPIGDEYRRYIEGIIRLT